jgi:hypothetical protein
VSATEVNDVDALTAAIADIVEARESHENWARYIRTKPDEAAEPLPQIDVAGAEDHHLEWIAKYDRVLTILRARRNALRSQRRRA